MVKFYLHLAYQLGMTPHSFDGYIWNFTSEICKEKNPSCSYCQVNKFSDRKS